MHRGHRAAPPVVDAAAIHPISLRLHRLANNLVLAPMAGVSNLPFRLIAREAGAAMGFSETISAKGLVMGGRKTRRLLETSPREAPVALQLFGAEPEVLASACRILEEDGVEWIDLNVGCPMKKFLRNGAGASLLRDLPRARRIVRAMRQSFSGTLSVKMRTGWDESSIVAPELGAAWPNPLRGRGWVELTVPASLVGGATGGASAASVAQSVQLDVFDVRGRHVRGLVDGALTGGPHQIAWDGREFGLAWLNGPTETISFVRVAPDGTLRSPFLDLPARQDIQRAGIALIQILDHADAHDVVRIRIEAVRTGGERPARVDLRVTEIQAAHQRRLGGQGYRACQSQPAPGGGRCRG